MSHHYLAVRRLRYRDETVQVRRFRDRAKAVDHARRWIADERTGTVWVYDPTGALAYTARASVVIDDPTLSASNHYSVSRTLAGRAERQVKWIRGRERAVSHAKRWLADHRTLSVSVQSSVGETIYLARASEAAPSGRAEVG